MKSLLVIAACLLAQAVATPLDDKGLITNLKNGELCFISMQCKSSCCHRTSGVSLARCAPQAAENQECSPKVLTLAGAYPTPYGLPSAETLYGTYYRCTCESGLKCDTDISIGGSITNTNFGVCKDPNGKVASK